MYVARCRFWKARLPKLIILWWALASSVTMQLYEFLNEDDVWYIRSIWRWWRLSQRFLLMRFRTMSSGLLYGNLMIFSWDTIRSMYIVLSDAVDALSSIHWMWISCDEMLSEFMGCEMSHYSPSWWLGVDSCDFLRLNLNLNFVFDTDDVGIFDS